MSAPVRIVLIDPSHPGNIGSVARAMKNMALSDLVLVRPRSFPARRGQCARGGRRRHSRGARRSCRASPRRSPTAHSSRAPPRGRARITGNSRRRATWPRASRAAPENRAALLFGSERYGLGNEDLQYCNVLVRIPANPEYCSLNLAMSVQLLSL
jgi:tRNA C32,U32 (ribose-2'-O)-methylase TrmJ